jgi:hypothetical protein
LTERIADFAETGKWQKAGESPHFTWGRKESLLLTTCLQEGIDWWLDGNYLHFSALFCAN